MTTLTDQDREMRSKRQAIAPFLLPRKAIFHSLGTHQAHIRRFARDSKNHNEDKFEYLSAI